MQKMKHKSKDSFSNCRAASLEVASDLGLFTYTSALGFPLALNVEKLGSAFYWVGQLIKPFLVRM